MINNMEINKILIELESSEEYQNLMKKNSKCNQTGFHNMEVSEISSRIIEGINDDNIKNNISERFNPKFANLIGICYDLGNFNYDFQKKESINNFLNTRKMSENEKKYRNENFGEQYEKEKEQIKNNAMQFNVNEYSAKIFIDTCLKCGIDKEKVKKIVNGILNSNENVIKKNPDKVEIQAVRIANRIASINRNTYDLIDNNKIKVNNLSNDIKTFINKSPENRIYECVDDLVKEYKENKCILGGLNEMNKIKNLKFNILNYAKKCIDSSERKEEIIDELFNTIPQNRQNELKIKWNKFGNKSRNIDILNTINSNCRNEVLTSYDENTVNSIRKEEEKVNSIKNEMNIKYPAIYKMYELKNINDIKMFEKNKEMFNEKNNMNNKIYGLCEYYMKNISDIKKDDDKNFSKEDQIVMYINNLDNNEINSKYNLLANEKIINEDKTNYKPTVKIGLNEGEISPTNDEAFNIIGEYIEQNEFNNKERKIDLSEINRISQTRRTRDVSNIREEITKDYENEKQQDNVLENVK